MNFNPQDLLKKYSYSQVLKALQRESYRRDFELFARDMLKIVTSEGEEEGGGISQLQPFVLNEAQLDAERIVQKQLKEIGRVRLVWLKARQPGGSTWAVGRGYHLISQVPHTRGISFAHDDETAKSIFQKMLCFYDNTPEAYKPGLYSRTDGLTLLDPASTYRPKDRRIGSVYLYQTARTALSGTGQTFPFVHLSECAKYAYPHTLWSSLRPAIPDARGSIVILESTAYQSGTWFRQQYESARDNPASVYKALFVPWFRSSKYADPLLPGEKLTYTLDERHRVSLYGLTPEQIKWYRRMIVELGDDDLAAELMKQEYPENDEEAWIDLSASVFDVRKLNGRLREQVCPPKRRCDVYPGQQMLENTAGNLAIWDDPERGEQYDIGADVATGQDGEEFDWSVASVWRRRDRTQVAEWRGKIDPIDYGDTLYNLGLYYNHAQVAVETNSIGFSTNSHLQGLGYPNVYIWRTRDSAVPQLTKRAGWSTTPESKGFLVAKMRHYVARDEITIRSDILLNEMKSFSTGMTPSGALTYAASAGHHDDAVMAAMIAVVIGDDERVVHEPEPTPRKRGGSIFPPGYVNPALVDDFDFNENNTVDPLVALAKMLK